MINLDDITNESTKEHNKKWPYFPHHRYRILIIGGSGSGKTNALLNLITEKIYLYAKDLCEPEYEYLIKNLENAGIKHLNYSNAFIVCSNTMDNAYENIDDYNPSRNTKILLAFDDMKLIFLKLNLSNKKFQSIIKKLFIRCKKLNISVFLSFSLIFLFQNLLD